MIDVIVPLCLSKHDISFPHVFPNVVIQPRQKSSFLQSSSRNAFLSELLSRTNSHENDIDKNTTPMPVAISPVQLVARQ